MLPEPSALPFRSALAALCVLGALGLATLYDIAEGPDGARDELLAATPARPENLGGLARFAAQTRYYLGNRYALRTWFIETNSRLKLALFGHADYPQVLRGQEGFLYLATEGTVPMTQGADPFSLEAAAGWRAAFDAQATAFDAQELPYLFVLAPNKHTIYPEHLPGWLEPGPRQRSPQALDMAAQVLTPAPLDLRDVLGAARAQTDVALYHRTDTHWNEYGAARALQAVLADAGIETVFPDWSLRDSVVGGDLARMLGQQPQRPETGAPRLSREGWACARPDGRALEIVTLDPLLPHRFSCQGGSGQEMRVVAFIDSFGVAAIPYLAANFTTLEIIWQDRPDAALAAELGADLVLHIMVERKLQTLEPEIIHPDHAG